VCDQNGILRTAKEVGFAQREKRRLHIPDAAGKHGGSFADPRLMHIAQKRQCNMVIVFGNIAPGICA